MKTLIILLALLLCACGHQDQQQVNVPVPVVNPLPLAGAPEEPSVDTSKLPVCSEHMHEEVCGNWGTKCCVND